MWTPFIAVENDKRKYLSNQDLLGRDAIWWQQVTHLLSNRPQDVSETPAAAAAASRPEQPHIHQALPPALQVFGFDPEQKRQLHNVWSGQVTRKEEKLAHALMNVSSRPPLPTATPFYFNT